MANIFLIVLLFSLLAIVVGVINPRWAMPWATTPSRIKATGLYVAVMLACFIGFGITTDSAEQRAAAEDPAEQQATAAAEAPAPAPEPDPLSPSELVVERMPEDQKSFLDVMAEASEAYKDAPNELVKSDIDRDRRTNSQEFTPGGELSGWVGVVEHLGTNGDGNGIVTIRANPITTFQTWNNAISDHRHKTLIPHDSELYDAIAQLAEGTPVVFSGRLLDEGSTTEHGSVTEPEFIVRFSSIKPLH